MTKTEHGWAVEVGEMVTVKASAYGWDHYRGAAEVMEVRRDSLLLCTSDNKQGWFDTCRVEGCGDETRFVEVS